MARTATTRAMQAERRLRSAQALSEILKYVGDSTRLAVILTLERGEEHVGALCEALGMRQPAVSHHLVLLWHGQVVGRRRRGKNVFYGLPARGRALAELARTLGT